jgi:hypothetical protein
MTRTDNLYTIPEDLPVPGDDGACDHLAGSEWPRIAPPVDGRATCFNPRHSSRLGRCLRLPAYWPTGSGPAWRDAGVELNSRRPWLYATGVLVP